MKTPYDFVSVALFAALVVLFLQRSISPSAEGDALWHYLLAATGCAVFNYLGNNGFDMAALLLLAGLLVFIGLVLRPFQRR